MHEYTFSLQLVTLLAAKSSKVELLVVLEVYATTYLGALHMCIDNRLHRRSSALLVGGGYELLPWSMSLCCWRLLDELYGLTSSLLLVPEISRLV